jgi:hypothetical protein
MRGEHMMDENDKFAENRTETHYGLWRIHWRIAGEAGWVVGSSIQRLRKRARNKVAYRALKAAGLPPILDWQGMPGSQPSKTWTDRFIGAPMGISSTHESPTTDERNSAPDVQLMLDEVEDLFGTLTTPLAGQTQRMMTAKEIDADGVWWDGKVPVPLLGSTIPVPQTARLRGEDEQQEVVLLVQARDFVDKCHACGCQLSDDAIILLTQHAKMMPAQCCDTIIWMTDAEPYDGEDDV